MENNHISVTEKYRRPCFAACAKCAKHGVIVFKDGSQSRAILSIEEGRDMLRRLTVLGKISPEDAQRIEDQLACSDIFESEIAVVEALGGAGATVLGFLLAEATQILSGSHSLDKKRAGLLGGDTQSFAE